MQWLNFATAYALRPKTRRSPSVKPISDTDTDREPSHDDQWIVCRQCLNRITGPGQRISVNGSHLHTFANPSGVVFEIGCFRSAIGCTMMGPPSTEFAWFTGYSWQIAICVSCQIHLGWSFMSPSGNRFYGLILDRIKKISDSH